MGSYGSRALAHRLAADESGRVIVLQVGGLIYPASVTSNDPVLSRITPNAAFGVFAHQIVPEGEPPRSYLERVYNIQRWTVFPRGGHFAPIEEPAAAAGELAAFFRDSR